MSHPLQKTFIRGCLLKPCFMRGCLPEPSGHLAHSDKTFKSSWRPREIEDVAAEVMVGRLRATLELAKSQVISRCPADHEFLAPFGTMLQRGRWPTLDLQVHDSPGQSWLAFHIGSAGAGPARCLATNTKQTATHAEAETGMSHGPFQP